MFTVEMRLPPAAANQGLKKVMTSTLYGLVLTAGRFSMLQRQYREDICGTITCGEGINIIVLMPDKIRVSISLTPTSPLIPRDQRSWTCPQCFEGLPDLSSKHVARKCALHH